MRSIIAYILSVLMTFVPPRYRTAQHLRGPTMVSAIIEVLLGVFGLVIRLFYFVADHMGDNQPGLPRGAAELITLKYGDAGTMLTAPFALVDFWLRPLNILLVYLLIEGTVRLLSALVGEQSFGTVPLYTVSSIHRLIDRLKYKQRLGPLVPDEVAGGHFGQGYDLRVRSCRPKLNWNPYMTIEYQGQFYQMFKEELTDGTREFSYYLRKNPVGRVVVVIDHYDPQTVARQS
jgi:hypothetical protein